MDSIHNCNYILKFLIIGNAGCGKTCILRRYTEKKFVGDTPHTIGAEFGSKIIDVDGTSIKIQIWDTAGQERFRSMARSYYHDAVGALLVYDITNRDSFTALHRWLTDARQFASPEIVTILIGNKIDKQETDENVTRWEANAFAQDNELQFIETSALTGENIEEAFLQCTRSILSKIKSGELNRENLRCDKPQTTIRLAETDANPTTLSDPYYTYSLSSECYC